MDGIQGCSLDQRDALFRSFAVAQDRPFDSAQDRCGPLEVMIPVGSKGCQSRCFRLLRRHDKYVRHNCGLSTCVHESSLRRLCSKQSGRMSEIRPERRWWDSARRYGALARI
jgi:hypothetical protein